MKLTTKKIELKLKNCNRGYHGDNSHFPLQWKEAWEMLNWMVREIYILEGTIRSLRRSIKK